MKYEKPTIKGQVSLEGSLSQGEGQLKPIRRGSGRGWLDDTLAR